MVPLTLLLKCSFLPHLPCYVFVYLHSLTFPPDCRPHRMAGMYCFSPHCTLSSGSDEAFSRCALSQVRPARPHLECHSSRVTLLLPASVRVTAEVIVLTDNALASCLLTSNEGCLRRKVKFKQGTSGLSSLGAAPRP